MALTGRQGVIRVLVENPHGRGGLDEGVGQADGQAIGEVDQAPALGVSGVLGLECAGGSERACAVNQERLHQRRAVGAAEVLEELLHQGQRARDLGG